MTNIMSMGQIFEPLRESIALRSEKAGKFVRCPMCLGFWVGLFWSILGMGVLGVPMFTTRVPVDWGYVEAWSLAGKYFADGCIASGTTWILYVLCCAVAGPEYEKL